MECINKAFEHIGITTFSRKVVGLNVDGTSVNNGIDNGLGAFIKHDAQWLQVIHCFNHRIEFALKDTAANTVFQNIEIFLNELYFLYKSSPKWLRELQRIGKAYGTTIPNLQMLMVQKDSFIKSRRCS